MCPGVKLSPQSAASRSQYRCLRSPCSRMPNLATRSVFEQHIESLGSFLQLHRTPSYKLRTSLGIRFVRLWTSAVKKRRPCSPCPASVSFV